MQQGYSTTPRRLTRRIAVAGSFVACLVLAGQAALAGDYGEQASKAQARLHFAPLSQVTGMAVIDANGEQLGEVSDAIIDQESGAIEYLVVAHDTGALDSAGQTYAAPYSAFGQTDADQQALIFSRSAQDLQSLPAFDAAQWATMDRAQWAETLDVAWSSVTGEIPDRAGDEVVVAEETTETIEESAGQGGEAARQLVLGSEIQVQEVALFDGASSTQDDAIVECASGQVAFLSVADDQGAARLVPWEAVESIDTETTALIIGQSELRNAAAVPESVSDLDQPDQLQQAYAAMGFDAPQFDAAPPSAAQMEADLEQTQNVLRQAEQSNEQQPAEQESQEPAAETGY